MKEGLLTAILIAATGLASVTLASVAPFNDTLTVAAAAQRKSVKPSATKPANAVSVIVIDAGHGGHDGGCSGTKHGAREKIIALNIALALGKRIERERPEVKVIYTRDRDVFVPLYERAAIANRARADLFISIHCNAMPGGHPAMGSETYVMGLHTAQHNLDVAKRENAAIHLEADAEQNYDFDPNSPAGHITLSMFQHAFLEQSMTLAAYVEAELGERDGHPSRGVKQAGFMVLKETAMPSVLVETGYLTNATEEAYLLSEKGQGHTVDALFEGVDKYLRDRNTSASTGGNVILASSTSSVPSSGKASVSPPAQVRTASAKTSPTTTKPAAQPSLNKMSEPAPQPIATDAQSVEFYVQLAASPNLLDTDQPNWRKLGDPVRHLREGNFHKYQAGPVASATEAQALLVRARAEGFKDAWLVGYRGQKRVSTAELQAAQR